MTDADIPIGLTVSTVTSTDKKYTVSGATLPHSSFRFSSVLDHRMIMVSKYS
jgi:hypothetical protein